MEVFKGVSLDYVEKNVLVEVELGSDQKAKLFLPVGPLLIPVIEKFKAQIEAGQIDPIKGTDLDKQVMLTAVNALKDFLAK